MALQMNTNLPAYTELSALYPEFHSCTKDESVTLQNAYIKVTRLSGNKNGMRVDVGYFESASNSNLIMSKSFSFTPSVADNAPNDTKQAYEYLKTQPEFAEAVDV